MLLCGSWCFLLRGEGLEGCKDAVGPRDNADRGDVTPADDALRVDGKKRALGGAVVVAVHVLGPGVGRLVLVGRARGGGGVSRGGVGVLVTEVVPRMCGQRGRG